MTKPNTHDINRVRRETSKIPFVCIDFERDGKEREKLYFLCVQLEDKMGKKTSGT